MKPDRSAMLVVAGESVFEVPVKSLTPRAVLGLPHGGGEGLAISIDSADRLAVAYLAVQPGPHTRVIVARLGDPKPSTDLHIDESVGVIESLDWCGPDAFALSFDKLGVGVVYETEVNKPMATLWPHGGVARHAVAGGKHYVLMIDDKKCVLLGLDFPPDDYLPLRNEAVQAKAPIGFLLTPEGIGR